MYSKQDKSIGTQQKLVTCDTNNIQFSRKRDKAHQNHRKLSHYDKIKILQIKPDGAKSGETEFGIKAQGTFNESEAEDRVSKLQSSKQLQFQSFIKFFEPGQFNNNSRDYQEFGFITNNKRNNPKEKRRDIITWFGFHRENTVDFIKTCKKNEVNFGGFDSQTVATINNHSASQMKLKTSNVASDEAIRNENEENEAIANDVKCVNSMQIGHIGGQLSFESVSGVNAVASKSAGQSLNKPNGLNNVSTVNNLLQQTSNKYSRSKPKLDTKECIIDNECKEEEKADRIEHSPVFANNRKNRNANGNRNIAGARGGAARSRFYEDDEKISEKLISEVFHFESGVFNINFERGNWRFIKLYNESREVVSEDMIVPCGSHCGDGELLYFIFQKNVKNYCHQNGTNNRQYSGIHGSKHSSKKWIVKHVRTGKELLKYFATIMVRNGLIDHFYDVFKSDTFVNHFFRLLPKHSDFSNEIKNLTFNPAKVLTATMNTFNNFKNNNKRKNKSRNKNKCHDLREKSLEPIIDKIKECFRDGKDSSLFEFEGITYQPYCIYQNKEMALNIELIVIIKVFTNDDVNDRDFERFGLVLKDCGDYYEIVTIATQYIFTHNASLLRPEMKWVNDQNSLDVVCYEAAKKPKALSNGEDIKITFKLSGEAKTRNNNYCNSTRATRQEWSNDDQNGALSVMSANNVSDFSSYNNNNTNVVSNGSANGLNYQNSSNGSGSFDDSNIIVSSSNGNVTYSRDLAVWNRHIEQCLQAVTMPNGQFIRFEDCLNVPVMSGLPMVNSGYMPLNMGFNNNNNNVSNVNNEVLSNSVGFDNNWNQLNAMNSYNSNANIVNNEASYVGFNVIPF